MCCFSNWKPLVWLEEGPLVHILKFVQVVSLCLMYNARYKPLSLKPKAVSQTRTKVHTP